MYSCIHPPFSMGDSIQSTGSSNIFITIHSCTSSIKKNLEDAARKNHTAGQYLGERGSFPTEQGCDDS
jgi:hypothetical protein